MEMKILIGAALFFLGWLLAYLFIRQILFNIVTATPLIRQMEALDEALIAPGARRYTAVSNLSCTAVCAISIFLVIFLGRRQMYIPICFALGLASAIVMLAGRLTPDKRPMFDSFCQGYYKFVPDDALRTAMYSKKPGQIKSRLKEMGIEGSFVPDFKKDR